MINTILGSKKSMSQTFVGDTRIPTTKVLAGPCVVTQVKTQKRDGYWSVQIGFGGKRLKNVTKPMKGHLKGAIKKSKLAPRFLREVRLDKKPDLKVGDIVGVADIFKKGDIAAVTGVSKGKGFQGVVKRWKFAGSSSSHGQKSVLRRPGSIGQGTTPGRVRKGKKMPGRMGGETVTIANLVIVDIDPETNELLLSGPIPGNNGSLVVIKRTASGKLEELEQTIGEVKEKGADVEEESDEDENKKHKTTGGTDSKKDDTDKSEKSK